MFEPSLATTEPTLTSITKSTQLCLKKLLKIIVMRTVKDITIVLSTIKTIISLKTV